MRTNIFTCTMAVLLSLSGFVGAEESTNLWFNPYAITGMTHYKLEYGTGENVSSISDDVKLSENIPFIGAGITGIYDKFSVDASFITSAGMLGDIEDQFGGYVDPNLANVVYERDIHLKRRTWNLSFGYELYSNKLANDNLENIVVFAGYKGAKTNYGWVDHEYKGNVVKGQEIGVPSKDNEFNTDGWFIGINYGREFELFGHRGRLGLNLSYAELNGEIETTRIHKDIGKGLRERTRFEKVNSDTKGISFGVSWAAGIPSLGDNWSYSIFLERASYEFDAKSGHFTDSFFSDGYNTHEILDLDNYDIQETIYSINLSISYFFDL